MLRLIIISITLFFSYSADIYAFTREQMSEELKNEIDNQQSALEGYEPLEVTGDALSWQVFAKTKEVEVCDKKDSEGYDICLIKPIYDDNIQHLDGKEVTLMGFMFPLDQGEKQKNFLIGPYPLSCPFNYHVNPSQVVEVEADDEIEFSYEPVTIKCKLLVRFNEETGVFFYLEHARLS